MAVIQISRIQQRRGQKLATGIPLLSSAELAWAVDTQELFIGNGSVAEGAPYVGNTRILTANSNVFENAVYQFMSTDPEITRSKQRKLLSKFDEYVSVLDYLVKDSNNDILWAETFESAVNDLCGLSHKYRKILMIPSGTYTFLRHWSLHSGVILRGETQANTILDMGDFTINSNESSDIKLQNFTINGTGVVLNITGLTDSSISDVVINGTYTTAIPANWNTPAVTWTNVDNGHKVYNVEFKDCRFSQVNTAVLVTQAEAFETTIKFDNCEFSNCYRGIYLDGVIGQSNKWNISQCSFTDIYDSAIVMTHGKNAVIRDTSFRNCGNWFGDISSPSVVIILFGDIDNNLVIDCISDRRSATARVVTLASDEVPEVMNTSNGNFLDYASFQIIPNNITTTAFATVGSFNDYIAVEYSIVMGDYLRNGTLEVTIGDLDIDPTAFEVVDNYLYSTNTYDPEGPDLTQQIELNAVISPTLRSVILTCTNGSGHDGNMIYRVTVGTIQSIIVPVGLKSIAGNQTIYLNWDSNSSPNGSPVAGYSLIIT